jgi:hypothetical protein
MRVRVLPDGTYDVIVIDTEQAQDGSARIEVTITLGPYVGHVVALRETHIDDQRDAKDWSSPMTMLGVPGTMRVHDGVPSFRPERP